MMVLDECTPYPATKKYATEAMNRTHNWANRALEYKLGKDTRYSILDIKDKKIKYPVSNIQYPENHYSSVLSKVSTFKDLREKSAKYIFFTSF